MSNKLITMTESEWIANTDPAQMNERNWSGTPILADALEDAGCNSSILAHLRSHCLEEAINKEAASRPVLHAKGCHIIDAILHLS